MKLIPININYSRFSQLDNKEIYRSRNIINIKSNTNLTYMKPHPLQPNCPSGKMIINLKLRLYLIRGIIRMCVKTITFKYDCYNSIYKYILTRGE